MTRPLFAKGAKGQLIRTLQTPLLPPQSVDGVYGGQTVAAVQKFQSDHGSQPTGVVSDDDWTAITTLPVPETFERSLAVTAAMEGHGFTLAEGNFDGQGITWGIIGYTLKNGEIALIIDAIDQVDANLVDDAFGPLAPDFRAALKMSPADVVAWANTITVGSGLVPTWRDAFDRLGQSSVVQKVQMDRARDHYGSAAQAIVNDFGLATELGYALAFDIVVQIGLKAAARDAITRALQDQPDTSEPDLRAIIAKAVADTASAKYHDDVLKRKMTFATGSGVVHGSKFVLGNWGLGDLPM